MKLQYNIIFIDKFNFVGSKNLFFLQNYIYINFTRLIYKIQFFRARFFLQKSSF